MPKIIGVILLYLDFLCGNVEDKQIGPKSIIDLIFFEKQSLQ
tara:strand:+ start:415 stop:540 length:126 start_codon:yes stop_codon:yes gene_type:complete